MIETVVPKVCTGADCTPTQVLTCGDGIVNQAYETCDDGNNIDGDGCNANCAVELKETIVKPVVKEEIKKDVIKKKTVVTPRVAPTLPAPIVLPAALQAT